MRINDHASAQDHYLEDQDSVDQHLHQIHYQISPKIPMENPFPEARQQSQGMFGSSRGRKNLVKGKLSDEALSVSTLSNDEFRKRNPSHMKAKYRQGAGPTDNNLSKVRSPQPAPSPPYQQMSSRRKGSRSPDNYRHATASRKGDNNSMVGSGSARRLIDGTESDQAHPNEINTDISQFLNTKQTFRHSMTGVTQTDVGDKEDLLARNSAGGKRPIDAGIRYAHFPNKVGLNDGQASFIHEFSPRV